MTMRAVGIDLGERRIGVAVSDSRGVLASPYTVVERSGDEAKDRLAIASLVSEVHGDVLVVGMPLSMDGRPRKAAEAAAAEARELASVVSVPVETFDERLTTVEATRLRQSRRDVVTRTGRQRNPPRTRGGAAGGGSSSRKAIDAEAAAVMLNAWLQKTR